MITLILQCLVAALTLVAGAVALRVARLAPAPGRMRGGWIITGTTFTLLGVSGVLQTTWAVWAYFAGAGAAVYEVFLRWSPAANHGRSILLAAAGVLLVLHVYRAGADREVLPFRWVVVVLVSTLVAGTLAGTAEGGLQPERHYVSQATLQLVALMPFLVTLLGAAVRSAMDRLLWLVLVVYALHQTVSILWLSAAAWWYVEGVWSPRPWMIQAGYTVVWVCILGILLRRLVLARRGDPVPPPLELAGREAGADTRVFR